jgi:hypothetical protein
MGCEWCAGPIAGHGRRFCSLSCSARHQRASEPWPVGWCERCGKPYDARSRSGGPRKFCTRSCAASARNAAKARQCERCGVTMHDTKASQRFCTADCYRTAEYERLVAEWVAGGRSGGRWDGVNKFARRWLVETFGEACVVCGWCEIHPTTGRVPVQVDHIDGDPYNHRPENLRLLCPNHHSLTSTFGALNRGNGRSERYRRP